MLSLYKFFTGKGQMVAFLLGVGLVLLTLLTAISGIKNAGYSVGEDFNKIMKSEGNTETFDFFDLVAFIPPILVISIIGIILLFGIMQIINNPKGSIKILGGFIVILAIAFIFYSTSEMETTGRIAELHKPSEFNVSETASKWISAGIKSVGVLFGGALVLMFLSEIRNLFK